MTNKINKTNKIKATNKTSRLFIYLINKLWLTLASLIILLALVFASLRILLPEINYFKADIENWIEEKYKINIDFEKIEASWDVSGPTFSATEFVLSASDGELNLVSINAFSIQLDIINSLLSKSFVTEKIEVFGAHLNFILDRKLGIRLDTLDESVKSNVNVDDTSRLLLSTLFAQKNISLHQSTILLETLSAKQFKYKIDDFRLRNYGEIHQLTGELIDESQGHIKIVAEIHGDPSFAKSTSNIYLEGGGIKLASLPLFDNLTHLKPASGDFGWRLWGDWQNDRWQSAIGELQIDDVAWLPKNITATELELNPKRHSNIASIEHFIGKFNWQFEDKNNGVFSLHDVNLIRNQKENVALPDIFFLFKQNENFDLDWDLLVHDLQISPMTEYLDVLFPKDSSDETIFQNSKLALNFDTLGIRFSKRNGVWYLPKLVTHFSQLSYEALFDLPKLNGLSGEITFANNSGTALIMGKNLQADFNQLFRQKIEIDSLELSLNWLMPNDAPIDFFVERLKIKNNDLTLNAKSRFYFQDETAVLSLYSELSRVNVSKKSLYLPSGIMSESLTTYLDKSVKSGELSIVKSVLQGPLNLFPFDNQDGLFAILGQLKQGEYQFLPDWPVADDLNVELFFEANNMDLRATSGRSKNNIVNFATARIKDFSLENPLLELELNVTSKNNSGRDYLLASPLEDIGNSLSTLDYKGRLTTELSLTVGLDKPGDIQIDGKVIPTKTQSKINIVGMDLTDLNGSVSFNQKGIKSSKITAKYYGSQINAKLAGGGSGNAYDLSIEVDGKLDAKSLQDFVGRDWAVYATGATTFKSIIQVGGIDHKDEVIVRFKSELDGIEINLPGEFYKSKESKTPFQLDLAIADIATAKIEWQKLQGQWQWNTQKAEIQTLAGVFQYNSTHPLDELTLKNFSVDANLKKIDLKEWEPIFTTFNQMQQKSSEVFLERISTNLKIEKVKLENFEFSDVSLTINNTPSNSWLFELQNALAKGTLEIISNKPWKLDLDKLSLNGYEKASSQVFNNFPVLQGDLNKFDSGNRFFDNPANWPEIDIHCGNCELFKHQFGKIQANLRKNTNGIDSNELNLTGKIIDDKRHQLAFHLNWLQKTSEISQEVQLKNQNNNIDKSRINHTKIKYELGSDNIGKLLQSWQYPIGVEDSSGLVSGQLDWPNKPWLPELLKVEGDVHFTIGKGNLSEVSDAKARLFSLFNLQSLGRRLTLDFKDIFKKGFFYDKITGDAVMRNNIVATDNVYIDGNAAKVELIGEVDLKNETIEQTALVTPQITSSLPVLIGWAIEPTTGLIVYLLNKLMEPAIDVVTQIEYRIHGALADIKVDEISKKNSKVKVVLPADEIEKIEPENKTQE